MLKVGDKAPDFQVLDHAGRERTLAEFRGKTVVLWFFPKAETPGCTIEGCGFRDQGPAYVKKGAQILGASFDTPAANAAFVKNQGFDFPILCDTDKRMSVAYGVADATSSYPKRMTFVISPEGTLAQVIEKVDVKTHPAALLETISSKA